jgi:hypothetical protein
VLSGAASAQTSNLHPLPRDGEPVWSLRAGVGLLWPTASTVDVDASTKVELGNPSPLITIDLIREIHDCCLEVFVSGLIPIQSVEIVSGSESVTAGHIAPTGIEIGMTYGIQGEREGRPRPKTWYYVSPFLGGFSRDRSATVSLPASKRQVAFTFPGGWGIGVGGGIRRRVSDYLELDVNAKWMHIRMPAADGRLLWSPLQVTCGLVAKLH